MTTTTRKVYTYDIKLGGVVSIIEVPRGGNSASKFGSLLAMSDASGAIVLRQLNATAAETVAGSVQRPAA